MRHPTLLGLATIAVAVALVTGAAAAKSPPTYWTQGAAEFEAAHVGGGEPVTWSCLGSGASARIEVAVRFGATSLKTARALAYQHFACASSAGKRVTLVAH